ncbi:hypothetical protein DRO47_06050 [Candidatus Bathyarchaeota archaeon]|nr:MAG: hypothetical protein DRO47_06050 [Candidatus Bathyarchaeota archaeon]
MMFMESKKSRKTLKELDRDLEKLEVAFARLDEKVRFIEKLVVAMIVIALSSLISLALSKV